MNTEEERKAKIAEMHKHLLDYTSMLVDRIEGMENESKVLRRCNHDLLREGLGRNVQIDKERKKFTIASTCLGISLIVNWLFVLFYVL